MVKVEDWSKSKDGNNTDPHSLHEFDEVDFTLENSCDSHDEDMEDELHNDKRAAKKTFGVKGAEACIEVEMR